MNEDILSMLGNTEPQVEQKKEKKTEDKFDSDILASMMTADGKDGNFRIEKEEDSEPEEDSKISILTDKVKERFGRYKNEILKDVYKNPDKYAIETKRGLVPIKEAIAMGWNPKTNDFTDKPIGLSVKEKLAGLNENDRRVVESFTDPSMAGIAAADAEGFGLPQDSNMIARPPQAMQQQAPPQQAAVDPSLLAAGGQEAEQAMPQGADQQFDPAILQQLGMGGNM